MKMEEAIENLARALDRLCDVMDASEYLRMALAIKIIGLQDAKSAREKHFIFGDIAAMVQAVNRKVGDAADEKVGEALEALHRVREMVMEEEGEEEMSDNLEKIQIHLSVPEWAQENGEVQRLRRMASDIGTEIACLEVLGDWQADELARQAMIRKRAVEKRIRDLTEGQP